VPDRVHITRPPGFTSFIGRRRLLAEVRQRLAEQRLVTLTGAGGIGKTRVAGEVAEDARRTCQDGAWWVGLDTVHSPALVLPTVASAMDLRAETTVPLTAVVADHVADRRAVLVLDGCERVLGEVVRLLTVLRRECPRLRILVTSRQALGMSGEALVRVPPMAVPEAGAAQTAQTIGQFESVALFADRAALTGSNFAITDENATVVADLCRALDGIPLALELAAARIGALSPRDMLDQLSDHLVLLDQGYVDAPERHRSLLACADWSFDLCGPAEQALWTRMSVFAGGCDLRGAQTVCAGDDIDRSEIADLVAALVDRSVVNATHVEDGTVRYAMPTYLAAYGRHRLVGAGELDRWRAQHAHWIAGLAAAFRARWVGNRQRELLRRARLEHANLRSALEFCAADAALNELVLDITTDLDAFWVTSGLANEARHWLGVGIASHSGKPAQRALAMVMAARFAGLQNDLADADEWLVQASAEAEAADDDRARGLARVLCALLSLWNGNVEAAADAARDAVPLLQDGDDAELVALFVDGLCLGFAGDHHAATEAYERAIARSTELGETFRRSLALAGLAELALADGDLEAATEHAAAALQMKAELDDRMGMAVGLDCLGRIALERAEPERAAILLGAAHAIWDDIGMRETGNPFSPSSSPWEGVGAARRRMPRSTFRRAFRIGSELSREAAVEYALTGELGQPSVPGAVEESPLTKRETEVAALVAQGLSNPEIAERLVISVRTAQGHVENILRKLGFTSRAMVAAWAAQRESARTDQAEAGPPGEREGG
jgi:non-specific serine/threonine protein kinase